MSFIGRWWGSDSLPLSVWDKLMASPVVLTWMRTHLTRKTQKWAEEGGLLWRICGWINTASEVRVQTVELTVWSCYTQFIWANPEENTDKTTYGAAGWQWFCVRTKAQVWMLVMGGERGRTFSPSGRCTPAYRRNVWPLAARVVDLKHLPAPGTTHTRAHMWRTHTYPCSRVVHVVKGIDKCSCSPWSLNREELVPFSLLS